MTAFDPAQLERDLMVAAYAAKDIMLSPTSYGITAKGDHDYVTECDKAVQAVIINLITKSYPDAKFVAEEQENDNVEHSLEEGCFVIDPIDGTHNFMNNIPFCAMSLAYVKSHEVLAGVVFAPMLDEMFHAHIGGGAYLGDEKIECYQRDLSLGMLHAEDSWRALPALKEKMLGTRSLGSCALAMCWTAAGRGAAYVGLPILKIWDMAAGCLIAKEAGLEIFEADGTPYRLRFQGKNIVCRKEDIDDLVYVVRACEERYEKVALL